MTAVVMEPATETASRFRPHEIWRIVQAQQTEGIVKLDPLFDQLSLAGDVVKLQPLDQVIETGGFGSQVSFAACHCFDLFGPLKQGQRVAHRTPRFTRVLPRDDDPIEAEA